MMSRSIRHVAPSVSSAFAAAGFSCSEVGGANAGRPGAGVGPSKRGSESDDPARSIVSVTGSGGDHAFGQSVPARSSRT